MKNFYIFILTAIIILSSEIVNAQWDACVTGLAFGTVRDIAVNGSDIYAATYQGVYKSTNNGSNWTKKNYGITNDTISTFLFVDDKVFAATRGGVFMSTNNGTTWVSKNSGMNGLILSMTSIGSNIFAVKWSDGVYLSTDYGDNWIKKSEGLTSLYPGDIMAKGNTLFLCTGDGMFISTDFGDTWIEKNNGLTIKDVRSITVNEDKIFIGLQSGGVYMSSDNGELWIPKSNGLAGPQLYGYALSSYKNIIFLGTLSRGLFISYDFGENWILSNYGLGGNAIGTIATDSIYVYAGTDMGAFRARLSDIIVDVEDKRISDDIMISPNPANDFFNLNIDITQLGTIQIFSILGEKVMENELAKRVVVSKLPEGMYYMQINLGNKIERTKFVIMR